MSDDPETVRQLVALVQWLALPYGANVPVFHGPNRDELESTYRWALLRPNDDPAFFVAGEWATSRPDPSPPVDLGDVDVTMVELDDRGNTVTTWTPAS